jgi:hypothetical protein
MKNVKYIFISKTQFTVGAIKIYFELREKVEKIDKSDPVLLRLNEILVSFLSEKLEFVMPDRLRAHLKESIASNIVFLFLALLSLKKWLYLISILILIAVLAKSFLLEETVVTVFLVFLLFFGKNLAYHLIGLGFVAADYFASGSVMKGVLRSRRWKPIIVGGILSPYGPIFPLLGVYVQFLSREDRAEYDRMNEVYWRYLESRDATEFFLMEREFWSKSALRV